MRHITFSIIIPTYNRPRQLHQCLASLAKLDYARGAFEVRVVDDGGRVDLSAVIDAVAKQLNITLIKQENAGPAAARNVGAKQATGDFLVFTDDDCCPDQDWLAALARQLQKTPDCIVGGRTVNALVDNPYAATSQLIVDIVYQHYNADPDHAQFFASNNMAIPASLFQRLNGFNSDFRTSEDRELCGRWLAQGYSMRYCADAVVYHAHALTLASFCLQHFNYGRGAYRFHALRQPDNIHQAIKLHSNVRHWLVDPLRPLEKSKRLSIAALLLLWQAVNALGFFWQAGVSLLRK